MPKKYDRILRVEFARRMNVTPQNVTRWIKEGKLKGCLDAEGKRILWPKAKDYVNSLLNPMQKKTNITNGDVSLSNYAQSNQNDPSVRFNNQSGDSVDSVRKSAGLGGSLSEAEARRIKAGYEAALKKLDYEVKSGKLISVDDVKIEVFNTFRELRDLILAIPENESAKLIRIKNIKTFKIRLLEILKKPLEEIRAFENVSD